MMPLARNDQGEVRRTPSGEQLWQCDNCGEVEPWNNDWAWYGSWKQLEDYGMKGVKPVICTCSNTCRIKMVATGRLPHDGLTDSGAVLEDYSPPIGKRKRAAQTSA